MPECTRQNERQEEEVMHREGFALLSSDRTGKGQTERGREATVERYSRLKLGFTYRDISGLLQG